MVKTEFNCKIAPNLIKVGCFNGSFLFCFCFSLIIGALRRSTSLTFAIVVRNVIARRELDTIKLAINVT